MVLSEKIARLIEAMLEEQGGTLEIGRNDLALQMGCVPSQINYVITSRFTPQKGYIVESRRGGGGFIRITKVRFDKNSYLMHFYQAIGDALDSATAKVFVVELIHAGILSAKEGSLLHAALSDDALCHIQREGRDTVRAQIFKTVILKLV